MVVKLVAELTFRFVLILGIVVTFVAIITN